MLLNKHKVNDYICNNAWNEQQDVADESVLCHNVFIYPPSAMATSMQNKISLPNWQADEANVL